MNEKVEVKSPFDAIDLEFEHRGSKIVLPDDPREMTTKEAIKVLQRRQADEEKVYDINETIKCHFYDGLVALARALKDKYGYSSTTDGKVNTMFGPMRVPPQLVNVRTGFNPEDFIQVPFGGYQFPGVEGEITLGYGLWKDIPVLNLTGKVKKKEREIVMEIVNLAQKFAKDQSIYRGKSIILEKDERTSKVDFTHPLEFFNPASGTEIPIFNADTERLIKVAVMTPIEQSAACRRERIPLKRGVLFEGPYGCGKTLVSRQVAQIANANGWTFILCTSAQALKYALTFAKMYQPAVVFAEDIDRLMNNRNEGANDLINQIDGVVGKNDEIITVLTTNFAENIDKAMLRPGRLDAVVSIRPPEGEAVERLVRFYAGNLLDTNEDLSKVGAKLAGHIPASIREVVERSKLAMLANGHKRVSAIDLDVMADSLKNHQDLMDRASGAGAVKPDTVGEAIGKAIIDAMKQAGIIDD